MEELEPNTVAQPAEQPVPSRRESVMNRLRSKYPDRKFEDDEDIYGAIDEDYSQSAEELDGYKTRENQISEMFATNPRSAEFLLDMRDGVDPLVSYVRNFGMEIKDVLDDPAMQEQLAQANAEYQERVAKSRELDRQYRVNMEESLETLRQFQAERNLSDEEIDAVVTDIINTINDGVLGKFSIATLEMFLKARNYDNAVAEAGAQGEVTGRNAKITEQLRRSNQGDGTQPLGGRNGTVGAGRRQSIFDLANEAY